MSNRIEIDRVVGILNGIRPTQAPMAQRLALRRDRKFQEAVLYRTEAWRGERLPDRAARSGLSSRWWCSSGTRRPRSGLCHASKGTGGGVHEGAPGALGRECGHRWAGPHRLPPDRTRPCLVRAGRWRLRVFPRLTGEEAAVYLHPLPRDRRRSHRRVPVPRWRRHARRTCPVAPVGYGARPAGDRVSMTYRQNVSSPRRGRFSADRCENGLEATPLSTGGDRRTEAMSWRSSTR